MLRPVRQTPAVEPRDTRAQPCDDAAHESRCSIASVGAANSISESSVATMRP